MAFTIDRFTARIAPTLSQRLGIDPAGRPLCGWTYPSPIDAGVQDTFNCAGDWLYVTRMSTADIDVVINSRVVGEPLKFVRLRAGMTIEASFQDIRMVGIYHSGVLDVQYGTGPCPIVDSITPAPALGKDLSTPILLSLGITTTKAGLFTWAPMGPANHPIRSAGDVVSIAGYITGLSASITHLTLCAGRADPVSGLPLDRRPLGQFLMSGGAAALVPCSTNDPVRIHTEDIIYWIGWATGAVTTGAISGYVQAAVRGYDEIQA